MEETRNVLEMLLLVFDLVSSHRLFDLVRILSSQQTLAGPSLEKTIMPRSVSNAN